MIDGRVNKSQRFCGRSLKRVLESTKLRGIRGPLSQGAAAEEARLTIQEFYQVELIEAELRDL